MARGCRAPPRAGVQLKSSRWSVWPTGTTGWPAHCPCWAVSVGSEVLLLDEIAGGLTEQEVFVVVEIVRALKRDRGVIWIEHIAHALMAVADRIMVLHFGKKIADGEPVSR